MTVEVGGGGGGGAAEAASAAGHAGGRVCWYCVSGVEERDDFPPFEKATPATKPGGGGGDSRGEGELGGARWASGERHQKRRMAR